MSDVRLFQTNDEGNILVEDGVVAVDSGLATAVYLALFGGNAEDAGGQDTTQSWWGNIGEGRAARLYRSETQHLLRSINATSYNLQRIEDAARRDLDWLLAEKVADTIAVAATVPGLDRIRIVVDIGIERFAYETDWKITA